MHAYRDEVPADAETAEDNSMPDDETLTNETPEDDKKNSMQDYAKTLSSMSDLMAGMHGSHKYSLPAPAPHRLGQLSGIFMNNVVGPASEVLRTKAPAILVNVFD